MSSTNSKSVGKVQRREMKRQCLKMTVKNPFVNCATHEHVCNKHWRQMLWAQVQTCRKNQFSSKMYSRTQHTGRGRFQKICPKATQEVVQGGIVSKIEQGTSKIKQGNNEERLHAHLHKLSLYLFRISYLQLCSKIFPMVNYGF